MGYGSDIDMTASNAAQRASFAANPVSVAAGYTPTSEDAGSGNEFEQYRAANQVMVDPSATVTRPPAPTPDTTSGSYGGRDSGPGSALGAVNANTAAINAPGKSYTAPGVITDAANKGLPSGSGAPMGADGRSSMTTEQSNAYYGPINAAMTAKQNQDLQQNRSVSDAQSNASVAIERARLADIAAQRGAGSPGGVSKAFAEGVNDKAVAAKNALTAAAGGRDYTKEAGASQTLVQDAQKNQLDQAAKSQGLVQGQQAIGKGSFELKHQQMIYDLADKLSKTDPSSPDYNRLLTSYHAMNGMGAGWKTQVVQGATKPNPDNPAGTPLQEGGRIVSVNEITGETHEIPLGQQAQGAQQPQGTQKGTVNGVHGQMVNGKFQPDAK